MNGTKVWIDLWKIITKAFNTIDNGIKKPIEVWGENKGIILATYDRKDWRIVRSGHLDKKYGEYVTKALISNLRDFLGNNKKFNAILRAELKTKKKTVKKKKR